MKNIVFFGDSITDAGRIREQNTKDVKKYGNGFVYLIEAELSKKYPNEFKIVNTGISGNRIVDLYARVCKDVYVEKPDVLSILVGVNDVWHEIHRSNGVEIDRFDRFYRMMLDEAYEKFPNLKVVIVEPFVLKGFATEEKIDQFCEVKKYAKIIEKIASDYNVPFIKTQEVMDKYAELYGDNYLLIDGVQPCIYGCSILKDLWLDAFENYIK